MRIKDSVYLIVLVLLPLALQAQQSDSGSPVKLNQAQKHGQLVFQQRCSVCHSMLTETNRKTYGPRLDKQLVDGNEDAIRQTIENGREGLMPGFKYGLTPSEINDIIEYLKTVDKLPRQTSWY